ncbi:MAG: hypothetical protein DRI98_13970 [Bacteroidetes bacterium]|nr:MAG: hypothetical protein DRI98_13970 [Bacteroidota bacterium]
MKPVDAVILLLTVIILGVFAAAVINPIISGTPLNADQAERISAAFGAIISIVSLYVGAKLQQSSNDEE